LDELIQQVEDRPYVVTNRACLARQSEPAIAAAQPRNPLAPTSMPARLKIAGA
jgi:hypothetical protein